MTSIDHHIVDTRIACIRPLLPPACLLEKFPSTPNIAAQIEQWRQTISDIIHGRNDRLLVIVGPCSIHDTEAGREYAQRLANIAQKFNKQLFIAMRVYFEKPRTTVGWKGLINDPYLDGSCRINTGLRVARKFMIDVNQLNLPVACEMLDTISPQFMADLISWVAIGARTTESQLHRELVSGLSMPCGFKNGTGGSIRLAVDGCVASGVSHSFLSVTTQGLAAIVETTGNPDCHVVLRGSEHGPNYSEAHIEQTVTLMNNANLSPAVMIDCSHGNSNKDHRRQALVVHDICRQIAGGMKAIIGVMIESNLVAGKQSEPPACRGSGTPAPAPAPAPSPISPSAATMSTPTGFSVLPVPAASPALVYGQSITDACIGWEETVQLLECLDAAVQQRRVRAHTNTPVSSNTCCTSTQANRNITNNEFEQ